METRVFRTKTIDSYKEERNLYSLVYDDIIIQYYSDADGNWHLDAAPVKSNLGREGITELEPKEAIEVCRKVLEILVRYSLGEEVSPYGPITLRTVGYSVKDILLNILN